MSSYSRESAGGADFDGALSESIIAFACAMVRLVLFSQIPSRRNGIAVAATRSLALRGILDSGSHRKSWADMKNVRRAQQASEIISTYRLQGDAEFTIVCWRPLTRYVAGRKSPKRCTNRGK